MYDNKMKFEIESKIFRKLQTKEIKTFIGLKQKCGNKLELSYKV